MNANDMYAIAAETQRTPGFGFGSDSGQMFAGRLEAASIFSRLIASFVDGFISGFLALVIMIGLLIMDHATGGTAMHSREEFVHSGTFLIIVIAVLVSLWLYYVCQETSEAQATFGKLLVGIKVADANGQRIGIGRSTIRFVVKMIPGCNPLLGVLSFLGDLICLAFTLNQKRTLHDLLAGTVVVKG